jgi:hypothetical protein
MQAKWRSGMVATDDYAEPITNLLRIVGTPLDRATLLSGELGRGPRCCFHASRRIKAKASDKHAEYHDSHSILSKPRVKERMTFPSIRSDVQRPHTIGPERAGPDLAGGRRLPRVAQPGNATVNLM